MDAQTLRQEIIEALKTGKSKEDIYLQYLQRGVTVSELETAFKAPSRQPAQTNEQTVKVIITIGVVMVAAGIFSFIAANWQDMTRVMRIAIIFAAMLTSYIVGWYFHSKQEAPRLSHGLLILGTIIYGAGIFLIGQMFNVRSNWPDGFILWMFGSIAMGLAINSYPLFAFSLVLAIIALASHPFVIFTAFADDPLLLTSSILLLVATLVSFACGWVLRTRVSAEIKKYY